MTFDIHCQNQSNGGWLGSDIIIYIKEHSANIINYGIYKYILYRLQIVLKHFNLYRL